MNLAITPSGVVIHARTAAVGPGYHAALIDLFSSLPEATTLGSRLIRLIDHSGVDGQAFDRLRATFASWLREATRTVAAAGGLEPARISLPSELRPLGPYAAASSLGRWTDDWIQAVAGGNVAELRDRAAEFFPWWSPSVDAECLHRAGLVIGWTDVPWRRPRMPHEAEACARMARLLLGATSLDPRVVLPERELRELALLQSMQEDLVPAPHGIGFRRGSLRHELRHGWTVVLPGYYHREDSQERTSLWFGDRAVHVSFREMNQGGDAGLDAALGLDLRTREPVAHLEDADRRGRAVIVVDNASQPPGMALQGWMSLPRSPSDACLFTAAFRRSVDVEWARVAFESLERVRKTDGAPMR